ncbi:MAG: DUF2157 domain-containing protein [Siphonobacter aquaeclarae]|nr:DUF2157 domain-containing protein [Siphonobacter aquaeclarae]
MTYSEILQKLLDNDAIPPETADALGNYEKAKPFSVHWELRFLLYLGVTLLSGGLGVLIYQHYDVIGPGAVAGLIALLMAGCFAWVWWKRLPYANTLTEHASPLPDFLLLLGCLLFLTLGGYLQYTYNLFGTRFGLMAIIPALVFFPLAYRFDHRGVLSMALTALASWIGVATTPLTVLTQNDFSQPYFLIRALGYAGVVIAGAWWLDRQGIKKHFTFTYFLLAGNLAFVAALAGWFGHSAPVAYLLILIGLCYLSFRYARQAHSFAFLLMALVYGYIALSYLFFTVFPEDVLIGFGMLYFMATCGFIVLFLFRYKAWLGIKQHEKSV